MNLSKEILIKRVGAYKDTENTTNVTGSDLDFTGYDGVLFFAHVEKKTSPTDTNRLRIYQKDSEGTYTALTGAESEATEDGMILYVDVYRPLQSQGKDLRAVLDITTASKTGDLYAVLYRGRVRPTELINEAENGVNGATVVSPAIAS